MRTLRFAVLAAWTLVSAAAVAAPISSIVVFGDALSDTGNTFIATGGTAPAPPYSNGRFSDGPVWVEALAQALNVPAGSVAPYLSGGENYAFGGARTGASTSPTPGVLAQLGGFWNVAGTRLADPDALYIFAGGLGDMRDARSAFQSTSPGDQAGREAAADAAVANLANAVSFLASRGATRVLILNLPDLGATPEAIGLGLAAASTDAALRFNANLSAVEASLEAQFAGLDVILFDWFAVTEAIRGDATQNGGATYGITNVVAPCGGFSGSAGASCAASLYSDSLHPSAVAHAIYANAALALVPEPSIAALLAGSAAILLSRARARR